LPAFFDRFETKTIGLEINKSSASLTGAIMPGARHYRSRQRSGRFINFKSDSFSFKAVKECRQTFRTRLSILL
jgi:hypothetical protein